MRVRSKMTSVVFCLFSFLLVLPGYSVESSENSQNVKNKACRNCECDLLIYHLELRGLNNNKLRDDLVRKGYVLEKETGAYRPAGVDSMDPFYVFLDEEFKKWHPEFADKDFRLIEAMLDQYLRDYQYACQANFEPYFRFNPVIVELLTADIDIKHFLSDLKERPDIKAIIDEIYYGSVMNDMPLPYKSLRGLQWALNQMISMRDFYIRIKANQYSERLSTDELGILTRLCNGDRSVKLSEMRFLNRALLDLVFPQSIHEKRTLAELQRVGLGGFGDLNWPEVYTETKK